jgi:tRNA U34 5-carboxymethylaminomethyl modifying GTPase MnmE/TrmE
LLPVATKSDLVSGDRLTGRLDRLNELFGSRFIATSVEDGTGGEELKNVIDGQLIDTVSGRGKLEAGGAVALTVRHRQAVIRAIESVSESIGELKVGRDEVAAMMLRAAYQGISSIEQQHVDERILDNIFSRFCIGK